MTPHHSCCRDARELLDSFDLLICSASFDGRLFRIPDPHLTFNHRSALQPERHRLMAELVEEVDKNSDGKPLAKATRQEGSPRQKVRGLPKSVFSALHESGAMMQANLRSMLNQKLEIDLEEERDRTTAVDFHHNFFARLFHRYRKYSERGIEFVGIPTVLHTAFLEMAGCLSLSREAQHSDIGHLGECAGEPAVEYLMGEDASSHQGPGHGGSKQGMVVCQEEVKGERAKEASRSVHQELGVEVPQTACYTRYEMDVLGCEVKFHTI
jgi:hypothetical protein